MEPENRHGDLRNITAEDLAAAAEWAGVSPDQAAAILAATVAADRLARPEFYARRRYRFARDRREPS